MTDLIDVLDEHGNPTGETLPRREIHRLGKRHRAVRLYLFNLQNNMLIQQRSMTVDHAPGVWSVSVAGHVDAGETSRRTLDREIIEELGEQPVGWQIELVTSYYGEALLENNYDDRQFIDLYVARANIQLNELTRDPQETAAFRFMPFTEIQHLVATGTGAFAAFPAYYARDIRALAALPWLAT